MYGVEAGASGLGGLAAQVPGGDIFLGRVLAQRTNASPSIGSVPQNQNSLPYMGSIAEMVAPAAMVNGSGSAVAQPVAGQQNHWSAVLDFHNSTAPWILLAILLLYGRRAADAAAPGASVGADADVDPAGVARARPAAPVLRGDDARPAEGRLARRAEVVQGQVRRDCLDAGVRLRAGAARTVGADPHHPRRPGRQDRPEPLRGA